MSAGGAPGLGGHSSSQDFDLNLAPIIDCFTVLITFMLVSASFLSIGILEAGIGTPSQTSSPSKPPDVTLELRLVQGNRMELKVAGKESHTFDLEAQGGAWDFAGLTQQIAGIQKRWPQTEAIVLSATDDIEYLHIIQCMEKLHQIIPNILLGGF